MTGPAQPSDPAQQMQQATCRLHTRAGVTLGAGLAIGSTRVLTCAHVVRQIALADGLIPNPDTDCTGLVITLDFPTAGVQSMQAVVARYDSKTDLALLTLEQNIGDQVTPLSLIPTEGSLWGHPFRAFGFPEGYHGTWSHGVLRGLDTRGWLLIEGEGVTGIAVQGGYSGTPVLDDKLEGIIGLIAQADKDQSRKVAMVIPTNLIVAWLPDAPVKAPRQEKKEKTGSPGRPTIKTEGGGVFNEAVNAETVIGRDQVIHHHHYPEKERQEDVPDLQAAIMTYLDSLQQEADEANVPFYKTLSGKALLRAKQQKALTQARPRLIKTRFRQNREPEVTRIEFDDAIEQIKATRRAVLLGEPGSGKTTTLFKLAADLIPAIQTNDNALIPVFVRLGFWRDDESLEDFLVKQAGGLGPDLKSLIAHKRIALLLDGLNEVPAEHYKQKFDLVKTFCQAHQELFVIVSCRSQDYTVLDLALDKIEVQPLDPPGIAEYCANYLGEEKGLALFWELTGEGSRERWEDFTQWREGKAFVDIDPDELFWSRKELPPDLEWGYPWEKKWEEWLEQRDSTSSLLRLAANPYLLHMLLSVYEDAGASQFPVNRGDLFDWFVDHLLRREDPESDRPVAEAEKDNEADQALSETMLVLRGRLIDLAYAMQSKTQGAERYGLAMTSMAAAEAAAFLNQGQQALAAKCQFLSLGSEVRFTHQLLQEYFAALALRERLDREPARLIWRPERWWEPINWEKTAILLAGLYSDDCSPVVLWLAEAQPELAARCIIEGGSPCPDETLLILQEKWTPRLTNLELDPDPKARAAVGRALGRLRLSDGEGNPQQGEPLDNRPGVSVTIMDGVVLPDIIWGEVVQPGAFRLEKDDGAYKPLYSRIVQIKEPYQLSTYPITYAQFETFRQANDVDDERWWVAMTEDDGYGEANNLKTWTEQRFPYWNHPRDGVSWYQAVAFCRWLSDKEGYEVRLPHEDEWEVAARYKDSRGYPYGAEFDVAKGNTDESDLGLTTAVGIYPNGRQEWLNLYDLSGNVWEWCANKYDDPAQSTIDHSGDRWVLRGGSWVTVQDFTRAASRYDFHPYDRVNHVGFRLVRRPPSHHLDH